MRVQRVLSSTGRESWTVVRDDYSLVEPVECYLASLASLDHSPNTTKAYAFDLRDFFVFLQGRDMMWCNVTGEDLTLFAGWLRLPFVADSSVVRTFPASPSEIAPATIRRKLAAVSGFYEFHRCRGVAISPSLRAVRTGWFNGRRELGLLSHLGSRQVSGPAVQVKVPKRLPKTLTAEQISAILSCCEHPRDRFFFRLLADTGFRVGEALGLRHEDIDCAGRLVSVRPRINSNGARSKSQKERAVPVPIALIRQYSDYLNDQYGDVDSDYVFISFAARQLGRAWTYSSVNDLVRRIRERSEVMFSPHLFRHTYATELLRRGVSAEIVQSLLGHASVLTTSQTYAHLKVEDARAALDKVGWFSRQDTER